MLGIGLRLLGIGKTIKQFVLDNWKILLPIILVIIAYFYISNLISNAKEEAYNKGVVAERTVWNNRVSEEDRKNREFEKIIRSAITDFGEKAVKEAAARISKETVYKNTIETLVKDNPVYVECKADQNLIDARNAIRDLGPPKGAKAVSVDDKGVIRMEF